VRRATATLLGLLGLALGAGTARAEEYRRITLADGRILVAVVEDTTDLGLSLVMPQGHETVRFDQVQSLEDVDSATWQAQPSWAIIVLPPDAASASLAPTLATLLPSATGQIPAVVVTSPALQSRLTPAERQGLAGCGADASCSQFFLDRTGAHAAVDVHVEKLHGIRQVTVGSVFSGAPHARREITVDWSDDPKLMADRLRQSVQAVLHLDPTPAGRTLPRPDTVAVAPTAPAPTAPAPTAPAPTGPTPTAPAPTGPTPTGPTTGPTTPAVPAPVTPAAPPSGPSAGTLRALAWVPLPGLPSMARKDGGGAAACLGITLPATAGMVYVAGSSSFTRTQLLTTGLASYYLLTVATNQAFGLRGIDAHVSAMPLPEGGAVIGVGGNLGGPRRARRP